MPAGAFQLGSAKQERELARALCQARRGTPSPCVIGFDGELDPRPDSLGAFEMDRTEVSFSAYGACVKARVCQPLPAGSTVPSDPRLPAVGVTHAEAASYCRFVRGRLPDDREWERAGRGHQVPARTWPWGLHALPDCARHGLANGGPHPIGAAPVGSNPCDASPEGVLDMAGNVREWVEYNGTPGSPSVTAARGGAAPPRDSNQRPVRGGSFRLPEWAGRVSARSLLDPSHRADDLGFRCVRAPGSGKAVR
ncbi:MAG: formylglycine-generating enzyme family protein [Polyangia bacterium]|nr:formylglycine-generating enzyme family protein [Polyangia bacterium]